MINFFKKPGKKPRNLKEVLGCLEKMEKKLGEVSRELEALKKSNKKNLQKIAITRYNPFSEVGGDQSFSFALLDEKNDGIVITSHYFRDSNRVYAKPVKGGVSKYSLSREEEETIEKAKNGKQ